MPSIQEGVLRRAKRSVVDEGKPRHADVPPRLPRILRSKKPMGHAAAAFLSDAAARHEQSVLFRSSEALSKKGSMKKKFLTPAVRKGLEYFVVVSPDGYPSLSLCHTVKISVCLTPWPASAATRPQIFWPLVSRKSTSIRRPRRNRPCGRASASSPSHSANIAPSATTGSVSILSEPDSPVCRHGALAALAPPERPAVSVVVSFASL